MHKCTHIIGMGSGHWTARLDSLARDVMVRAGACARQHELAARDAKRWGDRFLIITGVLGLVGGTLSILPTTAWTMAVGAGAGYVVGVVAVLDSVWRLAETRSSCALAQASYMAVSQDVKYQLSLPRHLRPDARGYVHAKIDKMVELGLTSPIVPGPADPLPEKDVPESESSSDSEQEP